MSTPRCFKFTYRLIDGLPPNESDAPSREAEYSDTEISGFKGLVGKGEGKKIFSYAISGKVANAPSVLVTGRRLMSRPPERLPLR
ncbi:hypothetical protein L3070_18875 [Enterobacter cloacae complex sp. ECL405]|uniref:hypothetical protein n=1 Tax=Enterobacter cloacae complex TaxID=354276 RepID=UPI0010CA598F|nr:MULTISPECIES: hypothetical protein [Enterobacter cloacae complex]UYT30458.1 hypothetical protein OKD05_09850 [Enterobacter cloacae]MCK6756350.1 hypothetical protein [Enterobacter asburiae]MCM7832861.1 hypothetical protein [Enterobacter asburiae]MCU3139874.1 hypothetical protein [Enterobacter asburiae]UKB53846.1 hypothetical protein L3070_18875 [Enterobacter cloacae complex sp. ECL405]